MGSWGCDRLQGIAPAVAGVERKADAGGEGIRAAWLNLPTSLPGLLCMTGIAGSASRAEVRSAESPTQA